MSWRVSPWIYPVWDSLCFQDLINYFLSHIREVFNYNLFKYFLSPFLFLFFFFWDPYNSNVHAFNVVPEVSETVLNSFHSFFICLSVCFSDWVIPVILSSRSFICSSALFSLLFIAFSSSFVSADEFSNINWLLFIVVSCYSDLHFC